MSQDGQYFPIPRPERVPEDRSQWRQLEQAGVSPEILQVFSDGALARLLGLLQYEWQARFNVMALLGSWASALESADREAELAGSEHEGAEAEVRRARALAELGEGSAALAAIDRAAALDAEGSLALNVRMTRALVLLANGRHDEALGLVDEALAKHPWSGGLRLYRADLRARVGQLAEAMEDLEVGLFLSPEMAMTVARDRGIGRLAGDAETAPRYRELMDEAQSHRATVPWMEVLDPDADDDEEGDNRMDLGEAA